MALLAMKYATAFLESVSWKVFGQSASNITYRILITIHPFIFGFGIRPLSLENSTILLEIFIRK